VRAFWFELGSGDLAQRPGGAMARHIAVVFRPAVYLAPVCLLKDGGFSAEFFRRGPPRLSLHGCMGATERAPKICKRYQTNELAVDSTEFGTRGSEVQILSPRPIFLSLFQSFRRLLPPRFFRYISVHSVQLRVVGTQSHIFPPTSYEMQRPL